MSQLDLELFTLLLCDAELDDDSEITAIKNIAIHSTEE